MKIGITKVDVADGCVVDSLWRTGAEDVFDDVVRRSGTEDDDGDDQERGNVCQHYVQPLSNESSEFGSTKFTHVVAIIIEAEHVQGVELVQEAVELFFFA